MIKFFRKIRKELLSESKFSKYLLYAAGEIFLVVIGILIALSINNWSTNVQKRNTEKEYLLSLKTEFTTNLKEIDDCISDNNERINSVEEMLDLFDSDLRDTVSEKAISNMMYSVFSDEATYTPSNGVLTDIISSGNLNLIRNKKLRQNLASFESKLDYSRLVGKSVISMKTILKNQLSKSGSIRKVLMDRGARFNHKSITDSVSNRRLFSLIEFENSLLDYYLTIRASNGPRLFGGIKDQIEQILGDLDLELKK